jgi:hypothetical protein
MATHSEAQVLPGVTVSWRQLAGAAGIAGVILAVVLLGFFGLEEDYPDIDKSAGEIRAWFEDNGTEAQSVSYVHSIALLFLFVPFFLGMRSMLAEAEGGQAMWTQLGFFGAALLVVLSLVAAGYTGVLATAVDELDDGSLMAFKYAEYITLTLAYGLGSALYLIGTGVVIARTRVLGRWLGWLAVLLGFVAVIGTADVIDPDPESFLAGVSFLAGILGFGVVVLVQGIGLVMKPRESGDR